MSLATALRALRAGPIEEVLIYDGPGVFKDSVRSLKEVLSQMGLPWSVKEVSVVNGRLLPPPEKWKRGKTLFVMTGGRCQSWDQELSSSIEKIRQFVNEGGFYLGICAGGYF